VRAAVDSGRQLSDFSPEELSKHSEALDGEYFALLEQRSWLESKTSQGGTALARVREQLASARTALAT
jgi:argininosuccinate lyase